ncbi:MAG: S8 family serine peptidase [Chloroflexi bacterium]|nr:S8 family serine peptidase [Chloroflexota bacterium]
MIKAEKGLIPAHEARSLGVPFNSPVFVSVRAQATRGIEVERLIKAYSSRVVGRTQDYLEAMVPLRQIEVLGMESAIVSINRASRPILSTVDQAMLNDIGAPIWSGNNFTGTGVKIGIIDGGFHDYTNGSRNLGAISTEMTSCSETTSWGSERHGTDVAEIINSIAPDAEFYLAYVEGRSQLEAAVNCLNSKGVKIINMSMAFLYDEGEGPGNGYGAVGGSLHAVNLASALGMTFVGGTSNNGQRHWSGPWVDSDSDGWMNFTGNDGLNHGNQLGLTAGGAGKITMAIRWRHSGSDGMSDWTAACTDFDLYVYDVLLNEIGSSIDQQYCVDGVSAMHPLEIIPDIAPPSPIFAKFFKIKWQAGPTANMVFDLAFSTSSDTYMVPELQFPAGSLLHPADTSASGAVMVGAIEKGPTDQVAAYSGSGPTTDNRPKPDLVTLTGISVTGRTFTGTSASTPVVAGGAALLRQGQPGLTGSQLAAAARNSTVPVSVSETFRVGNGRFRLSPPPSSLNRIVYIGTNGDGLISRGGVDGSSTWIQSNLGHDLQKVDVVFAPSQVPHLVYIIGRTAGSPGTRKEYRSTDSGLTWTQITDTPGSTNTIAIRPDSDTRYALSGGILWKSVNGGNWAQTALGSYQVPAHCFWYKNQWGSVHSFVLPTGPGSTRVWFRRTIPTSNSNGSNCDTLMHYTDDDGATWWGGYAFIAGGPGYRLWPSYDQSRMYMGYSSGPVHRIDVTSPTSLAGTQVSYGNAGNGNFASNSLAHLVFYSPGSAGGSGAGLNVSENGGVTYTAAGTVNPTAGMGFESASPSSWWIPTGGSVSHSSDNGYTWSSQSTGFAGALTSAVR